MKKILLLLIISTFSFSANAQVACTPGYTHADLDINNVRAKMYANSDMWWDLTGESRYEIPKGSGKTSLFAGSLWLGGVDAGGQLKVAAMTYRQTGSDFWPGPLDSSANISPSECYNYDKIFKIEKSTVEQFQALYGNPGYSIPHEIMNWPGNGNIAIGQSQFLAPFHDANGDGIYQPASGDYPDFFGTNCNDRLKGDQVLWWVFNDKGNTHTESGSSSLGVEVHAQAYAFSTEDSLNDATFYHYKIINRSGLKVNDFYTGMWVDPDLGDYTDDLVGCDVGRGMMIAYNREPIDGSGNTFTYGSHPPAIGIDVLKGPLADLNDGVDNNFNGIIDESGEHCTANGFLFYNNDFTTRGNPETPQHFYNYLKNVWKDGTPITYGASGYQSGGVQTRFLFPMDSDPTGLATGTPQMPWEQPNFGDGRGLITSGPVTFEPGEVIDLHIAVPWARDMNGDNRDAITKLRQADDYIQQVFDNCFQNLCPAIIEDFDLAVDGMNVIAGGLTSGATYDWNFGDGFTSTNRFLIHTFHEEGVYEICVSVKNNCDTAYFCKEVNIIANGPKVGVKLTRIEGSGNGNLELEMEPSSIDSILNSPAHKVLHPVYVERMGPVDIEVVDSTLLPSGIYTILLTGVGQNAGWKLFRQGSTDTIYSSSTITVGHRQVIPSLGLAVIVKQCYNPGYGFNNNNGFILSSISFSGSQQWLSGIKDTDDATAYNWIRGGDINVTVPDYKGSINNTAVWIDENEKFENIIDGTWAPYRLCAVGSMSPVLGSYSIYSNNRIENISSVDIVITSDQSKWSRSPVIETSPNASLSIGNAPRLSLRRSLSVDKNGQPDGSGTMGMGWFPGYAINIETGERLNIAFGEDSGLPAQNGTDMLWNPTSDTSAPNFGGRHFIYVFGHNKDEVFGPGPQTFASFLEGKRSSVPLYDEGKTIHRLLHYGDSLSPSIKRYVYDDAMWVTMPVIKPGTQLLSNEVKIRLRVAKPYVTYQTAMNPLNNNYPMYNFNADDVALSNSEIYSSGTLNLFPNPVSDKANIVFSGTHNIGMFKIYDNSGRLILEETHLSNIAVINLNDLQSGVYYYSSDNGREQHFGKFVKVD